MRFFYPSPELQAKEKFKNLIVEAIKDAKNFFNELKYQNFLNAVEMLDCLMESYKNDPLFFEKVTKLLSDYNYALTEMKSLEMIDRDLGKHLQERARIQLYQMWFRNLIDLANRTIFAGKQIDVDINLEEVFKVWNAVKKEELVQQMLNDSKPAGGDDQQ